MEKNDGLRITDENKIKPELMLPFDSLDISKLAITSANIGTWLLDKQTRNFFASDRMKELYGYQPAEEMSFEAALLQIPDKYRQNVTGIMREAARKHEPFYMEYPVIGFHDQQQRWLRVMGGADQSSGAISHFSGIVMDITEQKQNELRRSKFIGMVSHELKTPLTALRAYIQLLNKWAKKQKDSFSIGALSKVEKQIRKMTSMINGFLNFSGAEAGKIHLNRQDFSLNELIAEVIQENAEIMAAHHVVFEPAEPIQVNADREKIEQVIVNLLSNAVKYGDKDKSVQIFCELEQSVIKVNVRDSGIGVAQKDIIKLFKPHSRISTQHTEKISGFGIGLYLCAEIVKYHNGNIGVDSEPGKGSTFWFTLPVQETILLA